MQKQKVPFEGVFDVFAIRFIIDCEEDRDIEHALCWKVFSYVTEEYESDTKRLRDWISNPKPNGYESLHITVKNREGSYLEVQIRTKRMDDMAESGLASHWSYKGIRHEATLDKWLTAVRKALESPLGSDGDPMASYYEDELLALPSKEIFVFTPTGELRKLPSGATVLDFAFDIHTNLGATCTGAKVNNRAVPIREVLHNGDIVEVMTQKNQVPKSDWLSFCVTSKARGRIKSFLREEQMKHARMGREELERKLKNWKINVPIDEAVAYLGKVLKVRTGREVYSMIALQKIDFISIKEILNQWISGEAEEQRRVAAAEAERKKEESKAAESAPVSHRADALVIDEKINNIEYKLAKCCNPIKGDDIFGFVTISSGITIHRSDCPNAARLKENYPYRVMEARWRNNADGAFRATIAVTGADMPGLANQITEIVTREMKLNIRGLNFSSRGDGTMHGTISVEVSSATIVDMLIHSIMRIRGVQRAYRVNN